MSLVDMEKIVIGICTYNRNELLNICLDKISVMKIPDNVSIEVVVVDNSAESIAVDIVKSKTLSIHYFPFHGKGIASVRNEVLRQVVKLKPDYIALIDDDEYPCEIWISELYRIITSTDAGVVTGPALHTFVDFNFQPLNIPEMIKGNTIFQAKVRRKNKRVCSTASTNNVLFKSEILNKMEFWFDEKYKRMTGEDIDFFARIHEMGYKILWAKDAIVTEIVNPNRGTLKFIWKRNFNNGYLRIYNKKKQHRLNPLHYITTFINLFIYIPFLPLSILGGLTFWGNWFGKTAFSLGSFLSLFKSEPLVHYKD